jgi:hypothetical protein
MVGLAEDDGTAGSAHPGQVQFVIAGWSLEEERHCLVRGHESVKLEPRTTRLLAHMARHAGEPLGREDLLGEVWSGVVVGDEALTTAINKIRRAFQDDRHNPGVIETRTGRQLWFDRYERPFDELFEVRDEMGARLARALSLRVTRGRTRAARTSLHALGRLVAGRQVPDCRDSGVRGKVSLLGSRVSAIVANC